MMSEHEHQDGKFMLGFFIGGLLGAFIIFLLGTKEGKKTGRAIREKSEDILDELQTRLNDLEEKGKELVHQGDVVRQELTAEVEEKKDELTEAAVEKIDTALAHIEALQEHGRETTASLRKRLFKNLPKKPE